MTAPVLTTGSSRKSFLGAGAAIAGALIPARIGAAESYTLRLTVPQPANSAAGLSLVRFATAARNRSNGQLKIEVYPNNQLVSQAESIDGLVSGSIDLASQSSAFLVPMLPQFAVFDLPFLFKNFANAYRVLDGPIGSEFFTLLETKGIVGLGWIGAFKQLETSTKPVLTPADMKGLRIRIQSSALYVATYQALGAIPIPIDASEAFIALSQHTVDGLDLNLDIIATGQFYTVVKHVAMSNHFFSVTPIMASKRKLEALPPNLQKIVRDEAKGVLPYWRALITKQTAEDIDILKKAGVGFTEISYPAFRQAVDPVYASARQRIGADILDRVTRAANS